MMSAATAPVPRSLEELAASVQQQLAFLGYPPANWVPEHYIADGKKALTVAIIGAGQCGLAAAFALKRMGINDIRILESQPEGHAGPWLDYARMQTLRSPKHLLGPACGIPALTFQAWYRASYGDDAWEALDKIPRPMWQQYLEWFRQVLDIEVEFDTRVEDIQHDDELIQLSLKKAANEREQVTARKVILATGRDGLGSATIPWCVRHLDKRYWAHSAEAIDFGELRGKRVAVIGMGAAAMDNAAEALEQGAASVHLFARRKQMPTINKLMGISCPGFTHGFPALSPGWRWRIMNYSAQTQTPAPHGSTLRVSRHANAYFHFDSAIESIEKRADGVCMVTGRKAQYSVDYIIAATGFHIDLAARPELRHLEPFITRWKERYTPPPAEANAALGEFPWLDEGFRPVSRDEQALPALGNLHIFNYAASLSLGKVSGDIPAISTGAEWLAQAVAADLYRMDIALHWDQLLSYAKPELDGSEWTDADATLVCPSK